MGRNSATYGGWRPPPPARPRGGDSWPEHLMMMMMCKNVQAVKDQTAQAQLDMINDPLKQLEWSQSKEATQLHFQQNNFQDPSTHPSNHPSMRSSIELFFGRPNQSFIAHRRH